MCSYSVCSLASFKSLSQSKLHRFQHKGLTEEEDLAMPSDERQAVFQATKVRNHLKNDGSWINKSQDVQDTQSDVKARKSIKLVKPKNDSSPESSPCAESAVAASSSQDSSIPPESSYVMSALRKFEPKGNTPIRNGSNLAKSAHPVIEDSRRAHAEEAAKTVRPAEQPLADVPVKDIVKKLIVKPVEEPLKTHEDAPKTNEVKKPVVKPVEEPLKTHEDAPKTNEVKKPVVKPVDEPLKTHEDAPKTNEVKKPVVKPVEESLKTHEDVPKMNEVKKLVIKPVEEPLKTHEDAPKMNEVKKPVVKPVDEPLKTHEDASKTNEVKKPVVKPVEESLKTHEDASKTNEVKKPVVKPVEESLKTHEDVPKMNEVKKPVVKPVEEPLKTHEDAPKSKVVEKPIVKPVEEPLKTHADAPKKELVEKPEEKPVEEPLKTHIEETGKTPVKTVKTLHETPAKPSGMLTTENKGENMVEQVTVAHAPVVEASLAPRQAQNQPTSKHGESSTRTTEPTEEHHKLNSEVQLNKKGKTLCSFCKLPVDGNVKISINIPAICCHPDCFKCNDCSTPLGDLSSSMYHYAGKILCGNCFDQIFQL